MRSRSVRFGSKLRSLREGRELGLRELARRVGISPTFLSRIESGKDKPPAEKKLKALAKALGCDADGLWAISGRLPSDVIKIIQKHPMEYMSLLRSLQGFNAKQLLDAQRILELGRPELSRIKHALESSPEWVQLCDKMAAGIPPYEEIVVTFNADDRKRYGITGLGQLFGDMARAYIRKNSLNYRVKVFTAEGQDVIVVKNKATVAKRKGAPSLGPVAGQERQVG